MQNCPHVTTTATMMSAASSITGLYTLRVQNRYTRSRKLVLLEAFFAALSIIFTSWLGKGRKQTFFSCLEVLYVVSDILFTYYVCRIMYPTLSPSFFGKRAHARLLYDWIWFVVIAVFEELEISPEISPEPEGLSSFRPSHKHLSDYLKVGIRHLSAKHS